MSSFTRLLAFLMGCAALTGLMTKSAILLFLGLGGWFVLLLGLLQFRVNIARGIEASEVEASFDLEKYGPYRTTKAGQLSFQFEGVEGPVYIWQLRMRHSVYLKSEPQKLPEQWCPARQGDRDRTIEFEMPVAGRFMVFGVEVHFEDRWKLFRTWRYYRIPTPIRVLPLVPFTRLQRGGTVLRTTWQQQNGAPQKRRGTGTDLRDIREYLPGDSRRSIVWKHSLRHQKLLCRDFESEAPIHTYLLLDIGQSMREGNIGERKLDYACEVVSVFAKQALAQRDSVGLISFDGQIFHHDLPGNKKVQFQKILLHLEKLHQISEPDFSALGLNELCEWVSHHLFCEGLLAAQGGKEKPALRPTVEYVWDYIQQNPDLHFPKKWGSQQELIDIVLRSFCKDVGLELPYRYHQWVTRKSNGLADSIEEALKHLRGGQLLVVISDFGDILHWDGIFNALRLAKQRRHHIIFLSPFSPWFIREDGPNKDSTAAVLQEILTLEQWTWRKRVQRSVGSLGIPVISADSKDAPIVLLDRLRRLRQRG